MSNSTDGLGPLVFCTIITGVIVTWLTGSYIFWPLLLLGIFAGFFAASSVH